jgi:ribosomal protein L12E/L44/L45/RPP1/RPP2
VKTFSVKNFERFQHYKDRSPPWIKLYNELLDDYSFGQLPDASKLHLVAIWLLASRSNNRIPHDPGWIAKRISATEKVDLELLRTSGFIEVQDAGGAQAARKPDADPERESETDAETEEEREEEDSSADADPPTSHHDSAPRIAGQKKYTAEFEAFWQAYPTDALMSKSKAFEKWRRLSPADRASAMVALPGFRAHCANDPTYRPVHAERFLSQRRFDGFVEAAKQGPPAPPDDVMRALWGGRAGALVDAIGAAKFAAWFGEADWEEGPPHVLRVAKPFAAKWIAEHFTGDLMRLYGDVKVEVKG